MIRPGRTPERFEFGSVPRPRSTSISSDSRLPRTHLFVPPPVTPQPAFIAPSAASQIITTDQEFNTADFAPDDQGDDGGSATALVTPPALSLLNGFLDYILFNILAVAKSTQISTIRPAVAEVLKPRLAKEVVSAADDELSEYMGGESDEQFEFRGGQQPSGDFDLVRSWKRTRLRCMVYTRLGDMEGDDEDEHIARDGLGGFDGAPRRFASHVDNVTPAAAIFVTSIIEHLGEHALVISGETCRSRMSTNLNLERDEDIEPGAERPRLVRLVVEDHDMEKLAMNSTLGRLWRTWRKRVRSPNLSRTLSRESFRRRGIPSAMASSRKSSVVTIDELPARSVTSFDTAEATDEDVDPAAVPLPMSEHDVKEISIPGFSAYPPVGEVLTMEAMVAHKVRPRSLMVLPPPLVARTPTSVASSPVVPTERSPKGRLVRSQSLPANSYSPQDTPRAVNDRGRRASADIIATIAAAQAEILSSTPSEEQRQYLKLETMYEAEEPSSPTEAQTGLAISTPTAEEAPKDAFGPESPGRKTPTARHSMMPSLSGASVQVQVSRPGSAQTAYLQEGARRHDPEVLEGQGTAGKPRPISTIRRPRSKTRGSHPVSTKSEQGVPMPGAGSAGPAGTPDAPKSADARKSTTGQTFFANDDDEEDEDTAPSPVVPTASERAPTRTSDHGIERASVQRLPGQPSPTESNERRAESVNEKRPPTAQSSTSSKLKGLVGRSPHGESASLRIRNSSETERQSSNGTSSPHLEQLIQSDETIHYTLTPKAMRDMEQPISPGETANRSNAAEMAGFLKSTGPPGNKPAAGPKWGVIPKSSYSKPPKQVPIVGPPKPVSSSTPSSKPVAREATHTADSTRDFADFIRSTGPSLTVANFPKSPNSSSNSRRASDTTAVSNKFRPGSTTSGSTNDSSNHSSVRSSVRNSTRFTKTSSARGATSNSARGTTAGSATAGPSRNATASSARDTFASPTRGTTAPKLQARSAVAPRDEHTSDLIDFIREGPPTPGSHRIPRTVAPFRNTMDSDEMNTSIVRNSHNSSPEESHTSLGSSTALLDSTARANIQASASPKPAPTPAPAPAPTSSDDVPMPIRKQRRVPDPYAIDDDDDELFEELLATGEEKAAPPKREEESLIDFLRNAPPPAPDPTPQPFITTNVSAAPVPKPSGMRARFLRGGNAEKESVSKPSKTSLRSANSDSRPSGQSNHSAAIGNERKPSASVHVSHGPAMPKRQTETSDLADFLKSTGPPEPPRAPSALATSKGKDSGLSRFLMRRKKVEA